MTAPGDEHITRTDHPKCLVDYERLQKMDHYQTHTHPRPAGHQTGSVHSTSSSSPKAEWARNWQYVNFGGHPHHFHFPTVSVHDLKSKIEHVGHLAQPPAPAAPIVPNADIRETRQTYHIEIEVPSVIDKNTCIVHWLSPRILLVRGDIPRPDISRNAAHAAAQGTEDDAANAEKPQQMSSAPPQVADSSPPTSTSAGLDKSISPWEKLDMEWRELMQTQEQDHLAANGYGLKRVVSPNGEASVDVPIFLLSERKVGPWQRTFTLPLDVDMKYLKASLNGGLLSINLPKRDMSGEARVKVEIE